MQLNNLFFNNNKVLTIVTWFSLITYWHTYTYTSNYSTICQSLIMTLCTAQSAQQSSLYLYCVVYVCLATEYTNSVGL